MYSVYLLRNSAFLLFPQLNGILIIHTVHSNDDKRVRNLCIISWKSFCRLVLAIPKQTISLLNLSLNSGHLSIKATFNGHLYCLPLDRTLGRVWNHMHHMPLLKDGAIIHYSSGSGVCKIPCLLIITLKDNIYACGHRLHAFSVNKV